jgi:hypothetical protein
VVVVGDVDGDGDLDVAAANDGSGTIGVMLNQGDGTLRRRHVINIGAHVPSVRLGDLDGDTDLDMVVSSFGGGFWSWYRNNGSGTFTFVEQFAAPSNPSCAVLYDSDNDGDLDLGFFDEIADVVVLMRNGTVPPPTSACTVVPSPCRQSLQAGKSKLLIKDKSPNSGDTILWKWTKGAATTLWRVRRSDEHGRLRACACTRTASSSTASTFPPAPRGRRRRAASRITTRIARRPASSPQAQGGCSTARARSR